jgi:hypothetical protein
MGAGRRAKIPGGVRLDFLPREKSDNFAGLLVPSINPRSGGRLRLLCGAAVLLALLLAGCSSPPPKNTVSYGFGMKFQKNS